MVSTASTVRNPGQARSASRLAASGQTNTRRRTKRPWLSSKASKTGLPLAPRAKQCCSQHARQKRLALIGLEDQQIIRVPVQDPASDRLLAAHGIQSHDAILQGQRLEQRRDRGDLVRLAIDLNLPSTSRWPSKRPRARRGARPVEGAGAGPDQERGASLCSWNKALSKRHS